MAIATGGTSLLATGFHIGNAAGNALSGANKKRNDIKNLIDDLNIIISKLSKEYDNIPLPKYLNYI